MNILQSRADLAEDSTHLSVIQQFTLEHSKITEQNTCNRYPINNQLSERSHNKSKIKISRHLLNSTVAGPSFHFKCLFSVLTFWLVALYCFWSLCKLLFSLNYALMPTNDTFKTDIIRICD
jgi:hypothetical protein